MRPRVVLPAAPIVVDEYASADEVRCPQAVYEVLAAFMVTEDEVPRHFSPSSCLHALVLFALGLGLARKLTATLACHPRKKDLLSSDVCVQSRELHSPLMRTVFHQFSEGSFIFFAFRGHSVCWLKVQSFGGGCPAAESLAAQSDCSLHPPGVWVGAFLGRLREDSSWGLRLLTV